MMNLLFLLSLLLLSVTGSSAFSPTFPSFYRISTRTVSSKLHAVVTTPAAPVDRVMVLADADAVGHKICDIVTSAAKAAIASKGHFMLAIPGGSILKMLQNSGGDDWTTHTTIAYVNHKCVPMDDADLATHAKAMKLFMNHWTGCNPILMDGTDQGEAEASAYHAKLQALVDDGKLPLNEEGTPVFDLCLIGVGDDGHVGSLYPNREEVLEQTKWVLSVDMKAPPSITLSLPIMASAKQVVVAACGVSDKYPQGKSAGMRRAIVAEDETLQSFPAVGLRSTATWIMDQAAASNLGDEYTN